MQVLLINSNRCDQPTPVLPFGLGCVAAAVRAAGHTVTLLDLCFAARPGDAIRGALRRVRPDVVGISIRNLDNSAGYRTELLYPDVRDAVVRPCRAAFPGPIVIGGPAVGINGAELLAYLGLDLAIRGDGEEAMVALLRRLERGAPLAGLPGLVRRAGGRVVEDNDPAPVADLDGLPFDHVYDGLDLAPYRPFNPAVQVQTKRGCPLGCSYCTYNRIEGRAWRLRDPARVAESVARLCQATGLALVELTDSAFNLPLDHCKAVLRALIARRLDLELRTLGLNPGAVDAELVGLMRQAGFREVALGAEAVCDTTLRGLGKGYDARAVLAAARLLHDHGIAVMWYLLVGGPGETPATLRATLAAVNAAAGSRDLVVLGIGVRVYHGAPLAARMLAQDPACTTDRFLTPLAYRPEGADLDVLKAVVKREALRQTRYLMYDEDKHVPRAIQLAAAWVQRTLAPGQPSWQSYLVVRRLERLFGLTALRRLTFERRQSAARSRA